MSHSRDATSPRTLPEPVLILCADGGVAEELVRELAGRRYQPLVARPDWSWKAALEWARPAAAVVDTSHPAALSDGFHAGAERLRIGVVVFGEPPSVAPQSARDRAVIRTADARLIGGAVDDAIRQRSA